MVDRLIELLKSIPHGISTFGEVTESLYIENVMAKHLLANGVIVPPCKVGQILFIIEAGLIYEAKVKEYKYCSNSTNGVHWHIIFEELFAISEAHIGKSVFYTKEEAKQALKGGVQE